MRPAEKALVHQVHPAKIGMDVTASVISNILLWRGRPKAALAARAVLPAAGSLAVLAMADLDALAATRRGRYVLAHMPPSAQALRLAGDALMGWAAHRRRVTLLVAGAAVIAAGWSHAAWRRTYTWQRSPPPGCRHPMPRTRAARRHRRAGCRYRAGKRALASPELRRLRRLPHQPPHNSMSQRTLNRHDMTRARPATISSSAQIVSYGAARQPPSRTKQTTLSGSARRSRRRYGT